MCAGIRKSVDSPAAAPASESNDRRLKAVMDEEQEEDREDDPVSSDSVLRAGGNGSRSFGNS